MLRKKLLKYASYLAIILLFINLIRTFVQTYESKRAVKTLRKEVSLLEKSRSKLEKVVQERQSDQYAEKVARNELNLTKPGETIVVIEEPTNTGDQSDKPKNSNLSIPQQWKKLIFRGLES